MPKYGVGNQEVTPGYGESFFLTSPDALVEHAKRFETQRGANTFPGPGLTVVKRESLPEIVIKGCPHCGGDLAKEDVNWGYGDYSCNSCARAWYVKGVTITGIEPRVMGLQFTPVACIATEQPKRGRVRKERD